MLGIGVECGWISEHRKPEHRIQYKINTPKKSSFVIINYNYKCHNYTNCTKLQRSHNHTCVCGV